MSVISLMSYHANSLAHYVYLSMRRFPGAMEYGNKALSVYNTMIRYCGAGGDKAVSSEPRQGKAKHLGPLLNIFWPKFSLRVFGDMEPKGGVHLKSKERASPFPFVQM
jgi:hypothetical protein